MATPSYLHGSEGLGDGKDRDGVPQPRAEGNLDEYAPVAARMSELAKSMPGYIAHKGFVAEDGERVTIVEFASEEAHRAWSQHLEHVAAKKKGRLTFYSEYKIQICAVQRENEFRR